MEMICPSCEARYQVPESAIGEKGRQVSCLNCGHSWHAYPPLVLKSPAAPQKAVPRWQPPEEEMETQSPSPSPTGPAHSPNPPHAPAPPSPSPAPAPQSQLAEPPQAEGLQPFSPPPSSSSRSDQLAEIREMLAEVQSEDRTAAALNPSAAPAAPPRDTGKTQLSPATAAALGELAADPEPRQAPQPIPQTRTISDQEDVAKEAAIRDKLNISDVRAMAPKPPDPKRLRKAHQRKETRRKRREAAGSGAFLTGFLLIVMIAAVMVSLYLLHPQIIERVPSSEPALTEYVTTIDGWRVGIAETFEGATTWVTERLGEKT